jgi:signal peptidase I
MPPFWLKDSSPTSTPCVTMEAFCMAQEDSEPQSPDEDSSSSANSSGELSQETELAAQEAGKPSGFLHGLLEFIIAFAIMALVIVLLRQYVIEPFQIPSGSMIPTIEIGDNLYAEKLSVNSSDFVPTVGQVYTFTSPTDPSETLIKRVIAVEGQTIDLIDGKVYVDGVELDEPYVHGQSTYEMNNIMGITYPYTIPEGFFWAMGDNRGNSSDSRVFGPVPISSITGHAVFRYWPIFRTTDEVTVDFGFFEFTFKPFDLNIGSLDYT